MFSIVVSVQFPMKNILYHVLLALPSLVSISRALVLTPDAILVRNQLGYLPPNYRQVSAWTEDGLLPVAIKTHPLNGGAPRRQRKAVGLGTPFPTLYWLTFPDISRAISDLERRGYVGILEGRINSNNEKRLNFWIATNTTPRIDGRVSLRKRKHFSNEMIPSACGTCCSLRV